MKKLCLFAVLFASIGYSACAQKVDASKVPASVKEAFVKNYPGVMVKWEKEKDKYEANFKQDGKTMSVLYETNGTMTESEMDIKVADLPAPVLAYVKAHYPGMKIKEGAKITKADGVVNYEAEVNGKDVLFTDKGEFIREAKD